MGMRNGLQSPCLDSYLREIRRIEMNRKRRRNARLKRLLKEAAICIGAAILAAGGLLYMILNDPYEAPAAPIERTYWNGQQYTQEEYESMMSEREAYLQQEGMPCYADWRERRELKHLHICSGIILQMQDEKMDGN